MKKALFIIGILIALILLVALILPEDVHVERKIKINAPVELIFDQVNDLRKNINWSPWLAKDPNIKLEYGDVGSGLGASYRWEGNKDVGSGELTIVEHIDNQLIKNKLDFGEGGDGTGTWVFTEGADDDNGVEVTWSIDTKMPWPFWRYLGLFMESMVGPDFELGLSNLKAVSEALPIPSKIEIIEEEVVDITYVGLKDSISISDIGVKTGEMIDDIKTVMGENNIEVRSNPISVYQVWNEAEGYTVMEVGIPVLADTKIKQNDRVKLNVIPGGMVAKVVHVGPYDNLNEPHFAIDEWIRSNARQMRGAPWEVYVASPMNEQDSSKWITEIYYPIQ